MWFIQQLSLQSEKKKKNLMIINHLDVFVICI